jgi:hypothetical protein
MRSNRYVLPILPMAILFAGEAPRLAPLHGARRTSGLSADVLMA